MTQEILTAFVGFALGLAATGFFATRRTAELERRLDAERRAYLHCSKQLLGARQELVARAARVEEQDATISRLEEKIATLERWTPEPAEPRPETPSLERFPAIPPEVAPDAP